jgi:putative FmdB family regulatory protein
MPHFNYTCEVCGNTQEEFRPSSERTKEAICFKCGNPSQQSFSTPSLILMTSEDRWVRDHEVEGNGVRSLT